MDVCGGSEVRNIELMDSKKFLIHSSCCVYLLDLFFEILEVTQGNVMGSG
jgi:hypothetical protein